MIAHNKPYSSKKEYKSVLDSEFKTYVDCKGQNYYRFVLAFKADKEYQKALSVFKKKEIGVINPLTSDELLHRYLAYNDREFIVATAIAPLLLSIPIYPCLKDKEIKKISKVLESLSPS